MNGKQIDILKLKKNVIKPIIKNLYGAFIE